MVARNLKSVVFQNGDTIKQAKSFDELKFAFNNKIPIWCYYDFDEKNDSVYGKLYNCWAVIDKRNLEPFGWYIFSHNGDLGFGSHVSLMNCLGGEQIAGGKMKTIGTLENGDGFWNRPNLGASNISGFSGQPGGESNTDSFYGLHERGSWWLIPYNSDYSKIEDFCCPASQLNYDSEMFGAYNYGIESLLSVRCVKKK